MRISLHKTAKIEKLISPITGNEIEFSIRAYCPKCGCLVSHASVKAVEKAIAAFDRCKKCGCNEVDVKYTAVEEFITSP